jgi:hypothetical protein
MTMLDGQIKLGDQYEWCPYGHRSWPESWALVEVVGIRHHLRRGLQIAMRALAGNVPVGQIAWDDEATVREYCKRVGQP